MNNDDLYEILQVHPSALPEVIEAAYRRLAMRYHPDRNKSPNAAETMRLLNHAYEILNDPNRRAAYDQQRRAHEQTGDGGSTSQTERTGEPPVTTYPTRRTDSGQASEYNWNYVYIAFVLVLLGAAIYVALLLRGNDTERTGRASQSYTTGRAQPTPYNTVPPVLGIDDIRALGGAPAPLPTASPTITTTPTPRQRTPTPTLVPPTMTLTPLVEGLLSLGNGNQITKAFTLKRGLAGFDMEHNGESDFVVWLLKTPDERLELIASGSGNLRVSKIVQIEETSTFTLAITADGDWKISATQISSTAETLKSHTFTATSSPTPIPTTKPAHVSCQSREAVTVTEVSGVLGLYDIGADVSARITNICNEPVLAYLTAIVYASDGAILRAGDYYLSSGLCLRPGESQVVTIHVYGNFGEMSIGQYDVEARHDYPPNRFSLCP